MNKLKQQAEGVGQEEQEYKDEGDIE